MVRELVTAYLLGTSAFKDGFAALFWLGNILYSPFLEPILKFTVPQYLSALSKPKFAVRVAVQLLGAMGVLLAAVYGFRFWLLNTVYGGLLPASLNVALAFFGWMMVYRILLILLNYWAQLLNAHHAYGESELRMSIFSLFVIAFLGGNWTVFGLPPLVGGYVIGIGAANLVLMGILWRKEIVPFHRFWELLSLGSGGSRIFWKGFWQLMVVETVSWAPLLYLQHRISMFGPQVLSAFDYSFKFYVLVHSTLMMAVLTPYLTRLSSEAAQGRFSMLFFRRVALWLLALGGGTLLLLWAAKGAVAWVMIRGAFTATSFGYAYPMFAVFCAGIGVHSIFLQTQYMYLAFSRFRWYILSILIQQAALWAGVVLLGAYGWLWIPAAVGLSYAVALLALGLIALYKRRPV